MTVRALLAALLSAFATSTALHMPVGAAPAAKCAAHQLSSPRRSSPLMEELPEQATTDAEAASAPEPEPVPEQRSIFDPETTVGGVTIPLPPIVCTAIVSLGSAGLIEFSKAITPAWEAVRSSL